MEQKVQEVFEKVRVTAVAAASAAGKAADAAGKKAGELVGTTRMNLQIFDLNNEIDLLFKEIGKSVYLTHTGVEADSQEIDRKIQQIDEKYLAIAQLKQQIEELRATVKCPKCGNACSRDDVFCSVCGQQL
ncbi:zinc ribbon domain-containing protein [Acidaminobacterium chupaoyuni]